MIYHSTKLHKVLGLAGVVASLCLPVLSQAQVISYTISTFTGQGGTSGYSGDGGSASGAQFAGPFGLVADSSGNLFISDQDNNRVRKVSSGTVNTVAGNGTEGYSGDGSSATSAEIDNPSGLALDSSGNLYIADSGSFVVRVVKGGTISTIAGENSLGPGFAGDGGTATTAQLANPSGVAVDSSGNVYIADTINNVVRVVCANTTLVVCKGLSSGIITTFAGEWVAGPGYSGDGGMANVSQLNGPVGVAVDNAGNVYIADTGNSVIRKVNTQGIISSVAGNNAAGYSGDGGPALQASLSFPKGIAVDSAGNLYIADTGNSVIRLVGTNNNIVTIAGNGVPAFSGDGGAATKASLQFPTGIVVSRSNIYVADDGNNAIRLLTPTVLKPAVNGVISASGFGAFASVAPGGWIEIYGTQLAEDSRGWTTGDFNGFNAPTMLDGTSVTIGGQAAYIAYISPGQVNAQIPLGLGSGAQSLVLTVGSSPSNSFSVNIDGTQAGLLAPAVLKIGGNQYAGALFPNSDTFVLPAGAVNGLTSQPATPGQTITFYGVGFGAVNPAVAAGQIVSGQNMLTAPLQIFFGSEQATVTYAGLAPGEVGLYQFNVVVPSVPASDLVPVTFMLNGATGTQTLFTAVGN